METMKDIKARFASAKEGEYNALFRHYENDERSGVQKLIQQYHKKLQALEDERVRTESMKKYEHEYEHLGYLCEQFLLELEWQVRRGLMRSISCRQPMRQCARQ